MNIIERPQWLPSALAALLTLSVILTRQSAPAADFTINGQRFTVPEGFVVELAAGTDLVQRPVSAGFAADGRLYVTDSSGSNDKPDQQLKNPPHRILCLEDTNGDGKFDTVKVFADKVMFPQGCLWYEGSVYVAAPPSIWKFTDTDGDGVADKREEWFKGGTLTGCANDIHGPYLGPDGYLYWTKGAFSEQTHTLGNGRVLKDRAAHIYRARPDGTDLDVIMSGGMDNPVEVAFTREGEAIFTSTFIDFSQPGYRDGIGHAIYGGVFGKANDALEDGRVKRTGPDLMHPFVQFGAGAPSGLCRYDSMAFGADYLDNNFFASLFNLHKITRHILRPSGATYASTDSDFLVSDSQDFHPTDVLQDADGSLLVVDTGGWYKLCCPSSQLSKPDVLGAIYRVKRKDVPHLSGPELKTARLRLTQPPVMADNTLSTPLKRAVWKNDPVNASWFREIVALHGPRAFTNAESAHIVCIAAEGLGRLRDRSGATVLLYSWPMDLSLENSVCRALIEIGDYTNTFRILVGLWPELGKLHPEIQATMIDPLVGFYPKNPGAIFPGMQRIGLIALDQMDGHSLKPADTVLFLDAGLVPNAPDGIGGKFQLGFDLANAPRLRETAQWILGRHPEWGEELAGWFRHELGAANPNSARRAQLHAQFSILTRGESGQQLLADAVTKPGFKADTRVAALNAMAEAKLKQTPASWSDAVLQGLDATPSGTDVSLRSAAIRAARTVSGSDDVSATLNKIGEDTQLPVAARLDALSALPAGSSLSTSGFDFVCGQLAPTNAPTVRASAVSVLARTRLSAAQLGALADSIKTAGPLELTRLLSVFAAGGDDVLGQKLVAALKESKSTRSLNPGQIRPQLAKYPEATRKNAEEFLATLNVDAGKQAARLDSLLVELKSFPGDIRRGQAVFNSAKAACVACHKLGYLGGNVGPDLTSLGAARTERDLLESIVYPSASFVRSFEPMIVSTKSGEELSGVLKKDAADEIVLATGPGIEVRLARNDIVEMRPGTVSIMPQGWDEQLSRQELSDLITFLKNTKWGPQ